MKRTLFTLGIICLLVMMYNGFARADNIYYYYLTQDFSSGGLGLWPSGYSGFGTVTVKPLSASSAQVKVELDPSYYWYANTGSSVTGGGAGNQQFLFNWGEDLNDMKITNATASPGFSSPSSVTVNTSGPYGTSTSGYFNVGLSIDNIGKGGSTPYYNTISFTITDKVDNDLLADFAASNGTTIFAADVVNNNSIPPVTGLVGTPSSVPEPSTLALAVVGLAMLALFRKRMKLLA